MSMIIDGTVNGDTRLGPWLYSARTLRSITSMPPTPEATRTPTSSAIGRMSRPESSIAWRAAKSASCVQRLVRRASFFPSTASGSKPFTSPAIWVVRWDASNAVIGPMPP
jgi:hypothetical protein